MSFEKIINQKKAKEIIYGQLQSGRIPHAYLFLGSEGIGRKLLAIELAKALNCITNAGKTKYGEACGHCIPCHKIEQGNFPDVRLIDFAWQAKISGKDAEKQKTIKIETIRELQREINLKSSEGRWKVFIIEPAEKITTDAANCLLKTLEEPPAGTAIILLARHKENLPATVVSRTQIVFFHPLSEKEVASFLINKHSITKEKAIEIAVRSEGSLSEALRCLEIESDVDSKFWNELKSGKLDELNLMKISQKQSKTAYEFLSGLLIEAREDFRSTPSMFAEAIEIITSSRKMLDRNVNPQMVLDVTLLKIHKDISKKLNRSEICR